MPLGSESGVVFGVIGRGVKRSYSIRASVSWMELIWVWCSYVWAHKVCKVSESGPEATGSDGGIWLEAPVISELSGERGMEFLGSSEVGGSSRRASGMSAKPERRRERVRSGAGRFP